MLSYEHVYHAGNHADVLKHVTLMLMLERLTRKSAPLTVYDTHAGFGRYDLSDVRARKTGEAEGGIRALLRAFPAGADGDQEAARLLAPYLALCRAYAAQDRYPGSPEIARLMLRDGDRLLLSERHPQAIGELRRAMRMPPLAAARGTVRPQVHFRDGYEMLRALTPPPTGRGLALLDPSYEESDDFISCAETVRAVHRKWAGGVIALWYPLLERRAAETARLRRQIAACAAGSEPRVLDISLAVRSPEETAGHAGLYGSGMLVLNFPYQLDIQMRAVLPALARALGDANAAWSAESCG